MATLPADCLRKLWDRDGSLWSGGKYGNSATDFLGWVDVANQIEPKVSEIEAFVADAKAAGFERCVLAGMGGSSLAPLVFDTCIPGKNGFPVSVLDSTDPATVLRIERKGPVEKCLFVIASKSGSTAEPNAFNDYFYARVKAIKGDKAGENFAAITDPGSPFEAHAKQLGFRKIFLNWPDIGGRYSALSFFGMVPAGLMGLDLRAMLASAQKVLHENSRVTELEKAPAALLGQTLGVHAKNGLNKLTFLLPDELGNVGLWMEQLVAESTGKEGRGILPIALERIAPPNHYGTDRVFVFIHEGGPGHAVLGAMISDLRDAGHPVVEYQLGRREDIAGAMMHFEIATAIAGAVIEINPFDQPNVQESKDITKKYVAELESKGALPAQTADWQAGDQAVYGQKGTSLESCLGAFLESVAPGDYICIQAYLTESSHLNQELEAFQAGLRDKYKVAVTNGYGPRFLHSTGQFHKGGPNTGHFIQLTQEDAEDVQLPGKTYTFGQFRNAQALGDKDALIAHQRRVARFHLGNDPVHAISELNHGFCKL